MRWRAILIFSLAANLVLAAGWLWFARVNARRLTRQNIVPDAGQTATIRTNILVRKQFFSWSEVESDDYPSYIANLRDIDCPEQTIRDIIIADVNLLYARKRAVEIVTPEQQWWRAEPDVTVAQVATAKSRELDQERRTLLAKLLGTGWESGDLVSLPRPTRPGVPLDGPVLGNLPADVKQSVQEISARSADRIADYVNEQTRNGKPVDPAVLAKFRSQTRAELAGVLAPEPLEEYLLRYSQNATALRGELGALKYFTTTPEEFRALFRVTDTLDLQLAALADATDVNSLAAKRVLEQQRAAALKNTLGPERYELFKLLQDPAYRDAYAAAHAAGTPGAAAVLYEINLAAQSEQTRLRSQTNFTPERLAIELKKAELEQLTAAAQALGQELPPEPVPPPKPEPKKIHQMKSGETLNFLAQLYGVQPNDLRAANPNLDFSKLKGGENVSIPIKLMPPIPIPVPP